MSTKIERNRDLLDRVISRRTKFETGWWKRAEAAEKMYNEPHSAESAEQVPFNVLYANTEILLPALYSATPRPDVRTRRNGVREVAQASEALCTVLLDDNTPGVESFDCAMEGATLSALVPGMGGVRLRYYPNDPKPVRWEEFKYNQLVWGFAKKWSRVPWLAFLHAMTQEEIVREFKVDQKKLGVKVDADTDDDPTVWVYEVWLKAERRVVFLCEEYQDLELREVKDDPLKLAGFYPTPGLLTLTRKPSDMDPVPMIDYYQQQAEELNRVTVRLNKVLSAIRVKGVYHPLLAEDLGNILGEGTGENELIPAKKAVDITAMGGLDKAIWMLPIEKLIMVADQLYKARQQILQVIYQITGMADIVRGASVASESATAQNLKDKWGNLRLRRLQRTVGTYARDLLRLAIDAASSVLPPTQWAAMTGLQFPTQQQKQQQMLAYQQQAMLAQQSGQQPPPPPDLPMSWEEIVAALVGDEQRCYIVDIETDSTIDAEATSDKKDVAEFMTGFAQLGQSMQPLISLGPTGMKAAKAITMAVVRRFKLGREVEDAIEALTFQPPPPPGNGKEQQSKEELAAIQAEAKVKMAKADADMKALARKGQLDERRHQLELRKLALAEREMVVKAQMAAFTAQSTGEGLPRG